MKLPDQVVHQIHSLPCWTPDYELTDTDAIELIISHCAALCRAQIQVGPNTSLVLAAQNTMAAQCAEEIERAFGLEDTPK